LQSRLTAIPYQQRADALKSIEKIACTKDGPGVCIVPSPLPPDVKNWQSGFSKATIDLPAYQKALADFFVNLICTGDGNTVAILRSIANMGMPQAVGGTPKPLGFLETGNNAPDLVDSIMNCRASAQLTEADKALLLAVKRTSTVNANMPAQDSNT